MSDEPCPNCGRSDGVGWVYRWDPKTGKLRKKGEHVTCPDGKDVRILTEHVAPEG